MKKSIIAVLGLVLAVGLAAPSSSLRILSPSLEAGSATPTPTDGIRPEFKEAVDCYEAFMDEYVDFLEVYENSDNPSALLPDYANMIERYTEHSSRMDDIPKEELSNEELAYYTEAMMRISQNLLSVA